MKDKFQQVSKFNLENDYAEFQKKMNDKLFIEEIEIVNYDCIRKDKIINLKSE